jgi:hypothetical protein
VVVWWGEGVVWCGEQPCDDYQKYLAGARGAIILEFSVVSVKYLQQAVGESVSSNGRRKAVEMQREGMPIVSAATPN